MKLTAKLPPNIKPTAGERSVTAKVVEVRGSLAGALEALESGRATKSEAQRVMSSLKTLLAQEPAVLTKADRATVMKQLTKAQRLAS